MTVVVVTEGAAAIARAGCASPYPSKGVEEEVERRASTTSSDTPLLASFGRLLSIPSPRLPLLGSSFSEVVATSPSDSPLALFSCCGILAASARTRKLRQRVKGDSFIEGAWHADLVHSVSEARNQADAVLNAHSLKKSLISAARKRCLLGF